MDLPFLLFEGYCEDGTQLYYLECPMRLHQHQLKQGIPLQNLIWNKSSNSVFFIQKEI